MEHADGERDGDAELADRLARDPDARAKVTAVHELGELVRGRLELAADAVPDGKFEAMWRRIDSDLDQPAAVAVPVPGIAGGLWSRIGAWFDRYRGHIVTGAVSAGAVAALALVLRPSAPDAGIAGHLGGVIDVRPVSQRATPEINALDTPGGSSTVINLDDEDGHTAVIWVTPTDTVEGEKI
jgi:hypothetical protein